MITIERSWTNNRLSWIFSKVITATVPHCDFARFAFGTSEFFFDRGVVPMGCYLSRVLNFNRGWLYLTGVIKSRASIYRSPNELSLLTTIALLLCRGVFVFADRGSGPSFLVLSNHNLTRSGATTRVICKDHKYTECTPPIRRLLINPLNYAFCMHVHYNHSGLQVLISVN